MCNGRRTAGEQPWEVERFRPVLRGGGDENLGSAGNSPTHVGNRRVRPRRTPRCDGHISPIGAGLRGATCHITAGCLNGSQHTTVLAATVNSLSSTPTGCYYSGLGTKKLDPHSPSPSGPCHRHICAVYIVRHGGEFVGKAWKPGPGFSTFPRLYVLISYARPPAIQDS